MKYVGYSFILQPGDPRDVWLCGIRQPPQPGPQEVGEEGVRIHADGGGGERPGQVHPHRLPLPDRSLPGPCRAHRRGEDQEDGAGPLLSEVAIDHPSRRKTRPSARRHHPW